MKPLPLSLVADWVKGRLVNASGNEIVLGVCTDSRRVRQGNLFVALKGERFDGHDFVAEAIQKGQSLLSSPDNYRCQSHKSSLPTHCEP